MSDDISKRQDPAAFPANTDGNGAQQESLEEEPSSVATSITVELSRNARNSRKIESTLRAQRLTRLIDEFMSGMAPDAHVAAGKPEPTEQKVKALQSQHLGSLAGELTLDGLVRLILKKHLSHIDRLEEWEKQSQKPLNDWAPNMQVLIALAAILQKYEAAQKRFDAQVQTRTPIPEPQLSEEAQKIAKLSKLGQQLIREAGEKLKILLKRRSAEGA